MIKIVIVEDEEIIRRGLALSIDWLDMGCTVSGMAKDGREGLELILSDKPDIVITDIRMPKLSGIEMLYEARKRVTVYSIILTSYAEFDYAKSAIELGVSEYILKPVDDQELKSAIRRISVEIKKRRKYEKIEALTRERDVSTEYAYRLCARAGDSMDRYIRKTYKIIQDEYNQKLNIGKVADRIGISRSYLSRKLKQELGTSFVDLLNQFRIQQAIILLNEDKYMIYEISDRVGFSDYKHFCMVFKKYISVSPSEYQKLQ